MLGIIISLSLLEAPAKSRMGEWENGRMPSKTTRSLQIISPSVGDSFGDIQNFKGSTKPGSSIFGGYTLKVIPHCRLQTRQGRPWILHAPNQKYLRFRNEAPLEKPYLHNSRILFQKTPGKLLPCPSTSLYVSSMYVRIHMYVYILQTDTYLYTHRYITIFQ